MTPDASFAQRLLAESGLAAPHEPADVALVRALVAKHYSLSGNLERLATEKDDAKEKTVNNLQPEEKQLLDAALYETRMRFVSVASQMI